MTILEELKKSLNNDEIANEVFHILCVFGIEDNLGLITKEIIELLLNKIQELEAEGKEDEKD